MGSLPVLAVLKSEPPASLTDALFAAGRPLQRCSGNEAAREIRTGQLLVCERVPGWQALVSRAHAVGGEALLLGEPPRAEELPHLLPVQLVAVEPADVARAVQEALTRLDSPAQLSLRSRNLLERAESAELVSRFAQSIATQLDLPHVIGEAMRRTRELCDADGASLLLIDHATGELCFDTVEGGAGGTMQQIRLKPGQGVAGKVALGAKPMLVQDAKTHPDVERSLDASTGFTTASLVAVPLLFSGDVVGVLEAVRGEGRPPFEEAHLRRLCDLAPHVTIAVHNAQITSQLKETQAQVMSANAGLERKVQERTQQIARGKREWERTFDAINEPIAIVDNFVVRRANLAYARKVGLSITQIPGKSCHKLLAGRDTPCEGCPLLTQEKELSGEVNLKDRAYVLSGFRMGVEDAEDAVVVHYRDVSGQRVLERRLRETERLAAVGQLASGAAHEINNPLGFLTSNLRSLLSHLKELEELTLPAGEVRTLLDESAEMISESLEGARRVGEIVRGLRELAKLEIGRTELTPVNPSVTRAVRAEFGGDMAGVETFLGSAALVALPPLQLDQVLGHLLRNARQAVGTQGRVRIRTSDVADEVRIEIEDEGCGIPKDIQHRIFEPFFTTRGVGKGIGLGLTAAYGIVKRHFGEIEVRSVAGKGSVFTVRLPRAVGEEKRRDAADAHP